MDDGQFQHAMQLAIQKEIEEVLQEAIQRPLTEDEAKLLRWSSGV